MKKVVCGLMIGIFMMSFLVIAQGQGDKVGAEQQLQQNASIGEKNFTPGQQAVIASQFQNRIKSGNYNVNGKQLNIQEKSKNKIQLRVRNISADCDCNLSEEFDAIQNRTKLKIQLSNGRNAEVKIMPDVASEKALQRLRLKVCNESNNCSIELKEIGQGEGNLTRAGYEMQIQRHERLFGLFKMKAQHRVQVDAETGEIIQVKKPWWSFLAVDVEE